MKKNVYTAIAFAAVALFAACSSDDDMLTSVEENQGITIIANLPQNGITRVAYTETSAGSTYGVKETWESGDKPKLWWTEDNSNYRNFSYSVDVETGALSEFDKTPYTDSYLYLHYPNGVTSSYGDSKLTISPTGQANYIFKTINDVAAQNLLIGSFQYTGNTTQTVTLQNAYALLKFSVKVPTPAETITKVEFGNANNGVTGKGKMSLAQGSVALDGTNAPVWTAPDGAKSSISKSITLTLNAVAGSDTYKETTFYALVIPQTFDNGLYLAVTAGGTEYKYVKGGSQVLQAGMMYGIKAKIPQ